MFYINLLTRGNILCFILLYIVVYNHRAGLRPTGPIPRNFELVGAPVLTIKHKSDTVAVADYCRTDVSVNRHTHDRRAHKNQISKIHLWRIKSKTSQDFVILCKSNGLSTT